MMKKNLSKISLLLVSVLIISLILSLFPGGFRAPVVLSESSDNPYIGNTGYEPWYHYIGDVVNSANGNLYFSARDISIKARGFNLEVVRAYNSLSSLNDGPFGYGWTFNYNIYLTEQNGDVKLFDGDGSKHVFIGIGDGTYSSPPGIHSELTKDSDGFLLRFKDGTNYRFDLSGKLLNIIDRNGNNLTFSYTDGKLTSVADDSGLEITFNYNVADRISSIVDPLNRTISYEYDSDGNLVKVTDAMGNFTLYFYDNHTLNSTVNQVGVMLLFSYYAENNRVKEIGTSLYDFSTGTYLDPFRLYLIEYYDLKVNVNDALGHSTSIELNEYGNPTKITDPLGGVWITAWDNDMNMVSSTDANGRSYTYEYDAYGNLVNQTDPLGYSTLYEWENIDTSARYISLLRSTANALGYRTSFEYDTKGNLIKATDAKGNSFYNYFNDYGYVIRQVDFRGYETSYSYDAHGNMVSSTDAMGYVTEYSHDLVGRLLTITDALNHTTTYEHDANDRVIKTIDAFGNETVYNYNAVGSLISATDANGNEISYSHNFIGKCGKITDALGNEITFYFDRSGNLIKTMDANDGMTTTTYDGLGRATSVTDALGDRESYTYDAAGNMLSKTDKNGNTATYEYDALNRLISISYPDGSSVAIQYDATGNIIQVTNIGGLGDITYYSYDEPNRPVSVTVDYGSFTKTINYTYDANGNRRTMTDPDGGITAYEYDPLNRPLSITDPSNDVTAYEYDNVGRRIKLTNPNSVTTTYTYDAANRLLNLTNAKSSGEVISSYSYSYDNVGNRLSMTEANGNITSYEYDAIYRLINVTYPDRSTTRYAYDGLGNRLTETIDGDSISYTYDAGNRLLSAGEVNYSYDNNGNLISKTDLSGTATYEYDYENRLTEVTLPDGSQVSYQYSPGGYRFSKTTSDGTTYYLYNIEDVLMQLNETGMLKAKYTHGPGIDEPISMVANGNISYYLFDGLGSVTSLTNTGENVVATYQYDVFGAVKEETGTVENPYKFTSREYDEESGLYYYRARYYDPSIGRFLQRDPIYLLNLYTYVGNNPANWLDPIGYEQDLELLTREQVLKQLGDDIYERNKRMAEGTFRVLRLQACVRIVGMSGVATPFLVLADLLILPLQAFPQVREQIRPFGITGRYWKGVWTGVKDCWKGDREELKPPKKPKLVTPFLKPVPTGGGDLIVLHCGDTLTQPEWNEQCDPPAKPSEKCPQKNQCEGEGSLKWCVYPDPCGDCSNECKCVYDTPTCSCVMELCGAECAVDADCPEGTVCGEDCKCTTCGNGVIEPEKGEQCDPKATPTGCPEGTVCGIDCRCHVPPCVAEDTYGLQSSEVETLRAFRDQYLVTNPVGEALAEFYYEISPPIAEFMTEHPVLKPVIKVGLFPAVAIATVATNTNLPQKMAIGSSLLLVSLLLVGGIAKNGGFLGRKKR